MIYYDLLLEFVWMPSTWKTGFQFQLCVSLSSWKEPSCVFLQGQRQLVKKVAVRPGANHVE